MFTLAFNIIRTIIITSLILPLFVFAQGEPVKRQPVPDFMNEVRSEEDFNKLTPTQKQEWDEYKKANPFFPVSSGSSTKSPAEARESVQSSGVVDCFDYYNFGSVQVDLSATMGQTVPGAPMQFVGKIKNDNPYPIVDGGVYVKIFKLTNQTEEVVKKDGYPLVAQFALPEQYNLPANGEVDTSFEWQVPANAEDGEYFAAFYFQSAKRYNLLGLSFTDDVTGNQAHFSVTNPGQTNMVRFDKSAVTLNDNPHTFASFPQHFTNNEPVTAKVTIVNPKDEAVTVSLSWKLHDWDSLRPDSVMDTKVEIVELKAGESKTFAYVAEPTGTAVSYLVVEMKDGYSSSILNIRFVRDGVLETRINFPSITDFPLVAGQETSVFSCVHSTNLPLVSDNVLDLVLSDKAGNVIHSYQYQGDVTSAMMGMADSFVPTADYDYVSLKAKLSRHGQLIEEVSQIYDCTEIDSKLCIKPVVVTGGGFDLVKKVSLWFLIIIILVVLGSIFRKLFLKKYETSVGLFLMVVIGFSFGVGEVEAKTISWSSSEIGGIPSLVYFGNWGNYRKDIAGWKEDKVTTDAAGCWNDCAWIPNFSRGWASVTYKAEVVYDQTDTVVPDNTALPIGTKIRIREIAKKNSDIIWTGTGGSLDSPYGRWVTNAGALTTVGCDAADFAGKSTYVTTHEDPMDGSSFSTTQSFSSYILLNVNPPDPTWSSNANLSCAANGVCEVIGAGDLTLSANFPATIGKFYHRYYDHGYLLCGGNNVPLRAYNMTPNAEENGVFHCRGAWCNPGGDYNLKVGAKSISFAFTGYNPNNPPNAPTVTGPATGNTGESLTFTAKGTDPDGDTVRYLFDWNKDNTGDQWAPAWDGLVNSGTEQSLDHSWATDGTYNLQVRTMDSKGSYSAWSAPLKVTIKTAGVCGVANGAALTAPPTAGRCLSGNPTAVTGVSHGPYSWECNGTNGGVNVSCQSIAAPPTINFNPDPASVFLRESSKLTWTVDGASRCEASNGGPGWDSNNKTFSGTPSQLVTPLTTTVYRLTCYGLGNPALSTTKSATVSIRPPSVTLTANPDLIGKGDSSKLTWTVRGADSCEAGGGWGGPQVFINGTHDATVMPNITTTYNLTCYAPGVSTPVSTKVTLPSGSITAAGCDILPGDTHCDSNLKWSTANFLGVPTVLLEDDVIFSNISSNLGVLHPVTYGNQTFYLKDKETTRSLVIDTAPVTIGCTSDSAWTIPSVGCLLLPVMSVNLTQEIIRNGEVGEGKVTIMADYPLNCSVVGAKVGNSTKFVHEGSSLLVDHPFVTSPLTSAQVVQVECTHPQYPAVTATAKGRINVTATIEER